MSDLRDDFSEKTKRILQERVANKCSNPECRRPTSGPNVIETKVTRIGVAAHITAASKEGPRYNPDFTPNQRKNINNGIWLCQSCSKLVDSDPLCYTVHVLHEWKKKAEEKAREDIKGGKSNDDLLDCPFCGNKIRGGLLVCNGCLAEIIYGATVKDVKIARLTGFVITGVIVSILWYIVQKPLLNGNHADLYGAIFFIITHFPQVEKGVFPELI